MYFGRFWVGIGHPRDPATPQQDVADYVLHPPGSEDRTAIEQAMTRSLDVWPLIAEGKLEAAMLKLHTVT
jgi:PTH1 family peptidyl-tRNA hydrolase